MVRTFRYGETNFRRPIWYSVPCALARSLLAAGGLVLAATFALASCAGSRPDQTTLPVLKESGNLRYPMSAQRLGHEGTVQLKLFITERGTVDRVRLSKSSGYADLDDAAQAYAAGLTFHPATVNGVPQPSYVPWRIRFKISDMSRDALTYMNKVLERYRLLSRIPAGSRENALREVLTLHEQFAASSTDALSINEYIRRIVRPEIVVRYNNFWTGCPLRFTIFDDFIGRFPEMTQDAAAQSLLTRFAAEDIAYARTMCFTEEQHTRRDRYVGQLTDLVRSNYPTISLTPEL